jgi:hypothetical protein
LDNVFFKYIFIIEKKIWEILNSRNKKKEKNFNKITRRIKYEANQNNVFNSSLNIRNSHKLKKKIKKVTHTLTLIVHFLNEKNFLKREEFFLEYNSVHMYKLPFFYVYLSNNQIKSQKRIAKEHCYLNLLNE